MTTQTTERPARELSLEQYRPTCVHHWLIEPANGAESAGVCRRCGQRRQFRNSTEALGWEQSDADEIQPFAPHERGELVMAEEA